MINSSIKSKAAQKEKMAIILFWVFITIFSLTALLALCSVVYVIYIDTAKAMENDIVERFTWALWGVVLAQVAACVFALYQNLFGLSTKGDVADTSNSLAEIIDGLEANEIITEKIAEKLRSQYSEILGVSGGIKG